ncbi:hypothetical protein B9479_008130 [Cryptococcus floricola]|uniref:Uncharacterized protein n=1 Tax=Cryptococcus floricola TaxID=2591691 RepID=A0A5D3AJX3_9TREE|nr:hypothetical protein B9479_008130 [Cryptococcus floricola]
MFIPTLLSIVLSILAFARAAQFSNPIRDEAFISMNSGTDRQMFAQPIDLSQFSTEGPIFGSPLAKGQIIDGPSGE